MSGRLAWLRPLLSPNPGHLTLCAAIGLTLIGLIAIDTANPPQRGADGQAAAGISPFAAKQLVFFIAALVGMVLVLLPHHRLIVPFSYPLLIALLALLVVLLIPGMPGWLVPVRNGARRWFDLQVFLVQPSELTKIAFVLALACYLRFRENYRRFWGLMLPLVMTFVPMSLIVLEPDLGTAMIFLPVFFAMMIAAGAKLKHIVIILVVGLTLMPAMYPLLRPHQKQRIVAMVSQVRGETTHRAGIGFQGYKAMTLVGAGGPAGNPTRHAEDLIRFNRLPEAHNDMIFAVICARWGFLGAAAVVALYLMFFAGGLLGAALNRDPFARLVAVGIVAIVFTQMFVNVGMTIGILPITGMTLPLISYGGSSLMSSYIMVGLILNVAANRPIVMSNPAFEFDSPKSVDHVQRNPHLRRG